jgi:outer membrane protein
LSLIDAEQLYSTLKITIMKKIFILAASLVFLAGTAIAQKYAIIDTRYILDKMPDYKQAQKQLDDVAADWQKDIDGKQNELDKMYKDFEAEQVMLVMNLRKKGRISYSSRKKNCVIYSANALVLKAICSKKDRN